MSYRPSRETVSHLRDLYEMEGSYQKVADVLNKGRQTKDFTAYQVRQMLNTDRIAHGEIIDDPTGIKITDAQKRSLQRKTKADSRTYEKSYDDYREKKRSEKATNEIEKRIDDKLNQFESLLETAISGDDVAEIERLEGEISKYQQYKENLREAKEQADNYREWKGIRDKVS